LQAIGRREVALENRDLDILSSQTLRKTQAAGARANNHHSQRLTGHIRLLK
jgi:hypothetical protein